MSRLPPYELAIPPGIVTEETDRGTKGRWKDGNHIRFRKGKPEKLGGWTLSMLNGEDNASYVGAARALHDWRDLSEQLWAAIGTHTKLYLVNNGELFDITPFRATEILVDPFTTSNGESLVTVTDTAHGASEGDTVHFEGSTSVGGLFLDGEYLIAAIIDGDTYQIDAGENATSTDVGGGVVTASYEITIGAESNEAISGWGTGPYGGGPYGEGDPAFGVPRRLRVWSLDNFGEDLLASPNGRELYWWDRSAGPATRAVLVGEAPPTIQRMLVSPQARHVIALGGGIGSADSPGDNDTLLIRWADQEDFTDWIPDANNAAGDIRLDKGSEIITAIESRGDIVVWTDESLHALHYVGGALVYGIRHLGQSVRIVSPNAAVDVNGVVLFMADGDFMAYDGVIRVLDCPVRNHVFDSFNRAQGDKVYASVNKSFNEVWWFYPSGSSDENDRYVKFNYQENAWDFGTMQRTAMHDSSAFLTKPYGVFGGKLYQHETGVNADDENGTEGALASFIRSGDVEIDQAGHQTMHVSAMIPDFKTLTGSVDLTLYGLPAPQGQAEQISKGPFEVTSATERVPVRFKSRQVSLRIESDALDDHWRMGNWKAEARARGRRGA